jgi:hypothetical protein
MPKKLLFVNINGDPREEAPKRARRTVIATYVGQHYRNRSRPLQKSKNVQAKSSNDDSTEHASQMSAVALPPVYKGNSDPFTTTKVVIDPPMNDIVKFYTDCMLPAMAQVSPTGWAFWWGSNPSATRFAKSLIFDTRLTLCSLARSATLAAVISPKYRNRALLLTNKSMATMREEIAHNPADGPSSLHTQVIIHWSLETLAGNRRAATVHARTAERMYAEQMQNGSVDYTMLRYALHMDCIYSAMFLQRPLFVTRQWCEAELGSDEPLRDVHGDCHEGASNVGLDWSEIILVTQRTMLQWRLHRSGSFREHSFELTRLFYQVVSCHGLILRSYLRTLEQDHESGQSPATLLLAALFWYRDSIFHFQANKKRFYDTTPSLYTRLLLGMSQVERESVPGDDRMVINPEMALYVMFTGAQMERLLGFRPASQDSGWFTMRLAKYAMNAGVLSWEAIEVVLRKFVFDDALEPSGAAWFNEVMVISLEHVDLIEHGQTI